MEPRYQYDATTRDVAKKLGDIANISPKVIDYLIDSYSGVIGQVTKPSTTKTGFSIESQFKIDPAYSADTTNKLYDLQRRLNTIATTKNLVQRIPSKIVTPEEKNRNAVNKVITQISDLRKQQKAVESENLTLEQKKQKARDIQLKINRLASEAISKYGAK